MGLFKSSVLVSATAASMISAVAAQTGTAYMMPSGFSAQCPPAAPMACGSACFNSAQYTCMLNMQNPLNSTLIQNNHTSTSAPTVTPTKLAQVLNATAGPAPQTGNSVVTTSNICSQIYQEGSQDSSCNVLMADGSRILQCYNPLCYTCTSTLLCPTSAPFACGLACYDDSQYSCSNGALVQIPNGKNTRSLPAICPGSGSPLAGTTPGTQTTTPSSGGFVSGVTGPPMPTFIGVGVSTPPPTCPVGCVPAPPTSPPATIPATVPATKASTIPPTAPFIVPATTPAVPVTTKPTVPATVPATAPFVVSTTKPATPVFVTTPATAPATVPATVPATKPATVPATVPATKPATVPATVPATPKPTVPVTVLQTKPATVPATVPATKPATVPATVPATTKAATVPATTKAATVPATTPAATPAATTQRVPPTAPFIVGTTAAATTAPSTCPAIPAPPTSKLNISSNGLCTELPSYYLNQTIGPLLIGNQVFNNTVLQQILHDGCNQGSNDQSVQTAFNLIPALIFQNAGGDVSSIQSSIDYLQQFLITYPVYNCPQTLVLHCVQTNMETVTKTILEFVAGVYGPSCPGVSIFSTQCSSAPFTGARFAQADCSANTTRTVAGRLNKMF